MQILGSTVRRKYLHNRILRTSGLFSYLTTDRCMMTGKTYVRVSSSNPWIVYPRNISVSLSTYNPQIAEYILHAYEGGTTILWIGLSTPRNLPTRSPAKPKPGQTHLDGLHSMRQLGQNMIAPMTLQTCPLIRKWSIKFLIHRHLDSYRGLSRRQANEPIHEESEAESPR